VEEMRCPPADLAELAKGQVDFAGFFRSYAPQPARFGLPSGPPLDDIACKIKMDWNGRDHAEN
jgi:hypothetical protein